MIISADFGRYNVTKNSGDIPAWLHEDDLIYSASIPAIHSLHSAAFRQATSFNIDADHWAVRPLQAGLTPWAGGDTAPSDYNGGRVMLRVGEMYDFRGAYRKRWTHINGGGDIIGYPHRATVPVAPSLADQLHWVMHPDASPWAATEAHERGARFIIERERAAYNHAVRLLMSLAEKHFPSGAIELQPHDTISGVIDQIDNLTTAWKAPDPDSVTIARMTEAKAKKLGSDYMFDWDAEIDADADYATHVFRRLGLIKPDPTPTMLEQFATETGVTITDENRAAIERALSWHRDQG